MPRNIIHSRQLDLRMSRKNPNNKKKSNNLVMAVSKPSTVSTASAVSTGSRWTNMIQNCQRPGGCRGCSFR